MERDDSNFDIESGVSTDTGAGGRPLPSFRDRIIELRRVRAGELVPHPKKYRVHTGAQRAFLQAGLEEIGHADALIAMRLPDGRLMLINGHMRADMDPDAKPELVQS